MNPEFKARLRPSVAMTIHGEDLATGDFVALLSEIVELPSYMWECSTELSPDELVSLKIIPEDAGVPLKIFAVCLPFVYAKRPTGELVTLDTRRLQLVRLDRQTAKAVWKKMRPAT